VKIYTNKSVWDAALDRIRWLFDEFQEVIVSFSGGKDSTVIFELARIVARERGRLPLKVMFLDQEAEWEATVDTVRRVMTDPEVEPRWYQFPFRLFNATSAEDSWLDCWGAESESKWMRKREPYAITENRFGTDRFHELFPAIARTEWPDTRVCYLAGVRTEESPSRFIGLTGHAAWKWATWGKQLTKGKHLTMYPIYDWSYLDVWKAIHSRGWHYNPIYDAMYRYGVQVRQMRVSNLHHETAVHSLFMLQELEPHTYERLTQRIGGIDTAGKLGTDDYFVRELPFMFKDWREYRDYLLEKLITKPEWREGLRKKFAVMDALYVPAISQDSVASVGVQSILTNDWEGIKLDNWSRSPQVYHIRQQVRGKERKVW
jgi:predicted phosphoadenosine phosphosulfate sulfurtransferase